MWLIVSPEGQGFAEELRYQLSERDVRGEVVVVDSANQAASAYMATRASLGEARAGYGERVAVNITGGTKPMSAGAVRVRDVALGMWGSQPFVEDR